jgi:hypothetical protein
VENLCHKLQVIHASESTLSVTLDESVKVVRQHIVCCIISGISFEQQTFKKFIQLQVILNKNIDIYFLLTMLFAVSGLLFMFFEETYIHMIVLFFHVITLKSVEHYKGLIIVFVAVKVFEPRN